MLTDRALVPNIDIRKLLLTPIIIVTCYIIFDMIFAMLKILLLVWHVSACVQASFHILVLQDSISNVCLPRLP